ncbi:cytoplasmic dynein 2 intermediate chain 1 [Bufo bufo]|uniref:cytoplasmic dynein 2 intermediate chain 1 n=1 Tax=Bufo bufo TaxID=8384 RepID=UPI001ABDDED3|nr:cytoplasmic dynein 2 intermediate chain 1 [Bufo bufo]
MQPERHKSKEDTWKTEELKKHLKSMQSDNDRRHKERRPHREEEKDELARRRHKLEERVDEREHAKYSERDRRAERERGDGREPRREKEKTREGDKDKHHVSERHRTKDRERTRDKMDGGEKPVKEYGTSDLGREERKMRDSLEKSKHRSEDRERRHVERRGKEGRKRETEEREDQSLRHRKQSGEFNSQEADRERRSSDRKPRETSDREKRSHSKSERGTHSDQRSAKDTAAYSDRAMEKHSREGYSHDDDKEQRRRDKKDRRTRAHEENIPVPKSCSKESLAKQESNDEKEIEENINNTDAANEDSTNYEEDFEDYDDDFEDEREEDRTTDRTPEPKAVSRNAEVEEIQKAMFLENESIATAPAAHRHKAYDDQDGRPSPEGPNSTPRKSVQRGVFIDFGSAKQRQVTGQISDKQKKRSLEILRLIDLDFSSTFSLLDLPPVKEYEMYIRNFGKTNTKQAYVQCNEDAVERDIQTEEIDLEEKWTQHPGEGAVVCGGHKNDSVQGTEAVSKVDSQRLTAFLRSACQVITVLLEENHAEEQSNYKVQAKDPCLSISESCFHLNTSLPFLQGRSVYRLQFSEAQRHMLLTVHGLGDSAESTSLCEKYIICVWNIWQPSTPQKILVCESEVRCCCFSPVKASLVFAGTVDGSVLVWDLREDFSMHQTMGIEDTNWTFRSATFSTDAIFTEVSHTHPVKAVEPVPSLETKDHGISSLSSSEEMSGLSFQVASLDESGHLILWVVVELRKADLAGSQSDLGLIPGGKVKLVHSSSIHLSDKFFHKGVLMLGSPQTLSIKFLPRDFNHFVIGTDIGLVTHGTRYGLIEPPMQYTPLHDKLRPSQVTAIDFSPFGAAAFLAGCSDGSIRLHTMSTEFPAMQWNDSTNGQSVTALQWSFTRPTVFFVLDAASSIYIWDLSQNDLHPIAKESITPDNALCMSVFGEPEKNNSIMGLALGKSSGKVEIQYIKKKIAKIQPQELDKLHLILHEI